MSRKVVLFNPVAFPPSDQGYMAKQFRKDCAPLQLLALAGPLLTAGYEVLIINQVNDPDWEKTLLASLKENPVCVGVSAITGIQISYSLNASRIVKDNSSVPVIWGGIHATSLPEQTLANPCVDIVVIGEGEDTFVELVHALENKSPLSNIKGLCYKEGGRIKRTGAREFTDLSQQPPLPFHLLKNNGAHQIRIISSRGCPFPCRFCYNERINHRRWRPLPADAVLKMAELLVEKYGATATGIRFIEDNFFVDVNRARAIAEGLARFNLPWRANGRIDTFLRVDDAFLDTLEKSHFKGLYLGVESGSQKMLDFIQKRLKVEDAIAANRRFSQHAFDVTYQFMTGFPTETEEDIRATLTLIGTLLKENPRAKKNINIYTPYPDNDLFDIAVAHGFKPPEKLEDWAKFNIKNTVDRPWLDARRKRIVEMIIFCSIFLEKNRFPQTSLAFFLAHLYRPIAKLRLKHLFYRFPVEIMLARKLGLTG